MPPALRILVLCCALAAAACGPPPLAHTHASPDALATEVLASFAARDEARLRAAALDEEEFRRRIWPDLPAARPERNLPFSYVWGELRQKSDQRLRQALAAHGGHRYQVTRVRFDGATTDHGSYRVHRDAVFVVRTSAGGTEDLRLVGSLVEQDGQWKVFSYNVDD